MADVDTGDVGGAALQQAVGEAAGRGTDVEAVATRRIEREGVEGRRELVAASGDVGAFAALLGRIAGRLGTAWLRRFVGGVGLVTLMIGVAWLALAI